MNINLRMVYWKDKKSWLGQIVEYPDIASRAETPEALEQNLIALYKQKFLVGVPADYEVKEISVPKGTR